jgi:hypothetical protein
MTEGNPIDRIEHRLDIQEAALAANADEVIAAANERAAQAKAAALNAATPAERLSAHLSEEDAALEAIKAISASSRADWELAGMDTTNE